MWYDHPEVKELISTINELILDVGDLKLETQDLRAYTNELENMIPKQDTSWGRP